MCDAVSANLSAASALIMCAAVADWRPATISPRKLKKKQGLPILKLEPTPDILKTIAPRKGKKIFVGFAAETDDLEREAARKLKAKGLDLIVANDVGRSDSGFDVETNRVVMIPAVGPRRRLPLMSKDAVADHIMDWIDARWK
jgi:phosphopantothenoylcysteine decarboxylase/phosphopantothenate--cysteine ligase